MLKIARAFILAVLAFIAGLVLQCVSDPSIVGDSGVFDGVLMDSIGPKADAADSGAPRKNWFSMTYKRNGGQADKLLIECSDVRATMSNYFSNGKLVRAVSGVTFSFYSLNSESLISFMVLTRKAAPGQIDLSGNKIEEWTSLTETPVKLSGYTPGTSISIYSSALLGHSVAGNASFSTVSASLIAGSFSLNFNNGKGEIRELSGQFEAVPNVPQCNQDLKP